MDSISVANDIQRHVYERLNLLAYLLQNLTTENHKINNEFKCL